MSGTEQDATAQIVNRRMVIAPDQMVRFQAVRAAAHRTPAGGVDRGAPCEGGGHIGPGIPITPGISAIARDCSRLRSLS